MEKEEWEDDFNYVVESIDTISVKGILYRRFNFLDTEERGYKYHWVEGIGTSGLYSTDIGYPLTGPPGHKGMISCYEDGKCIFESTDFTVPATGIKPVKKEVAQKLKRLYDITGKRISNPRKGEVYIKGGEKYIEK